MLLTLCISGIWLRYHDDAEYYGGGCDDDDDVECVLQMQKAVCNNCAMAGFI